MTDQTKPLPRRTTRPTADKTPAPDTSTPTNYEPATDPNTPDWYRHAAYKAFRD